MSFSLSKNGWEAQACPVYPPAPSTNLLKHAIASFGLGKSVVYNAYLINYAASTGDAWSGTAYSLTGQINSSSCTVWYGCNISYLNGGTGSPTTLQNGAQSLWIKFTNTVATFSLFNAGGYSVTLNATSFNGIAISISLNVWHYVTLLQSGNSTLLYVDGVLLATKTTVVNCLYVNSFSCSGDAALSIKDYLFFTSMPTMDIPTTLAGFV